MSDNSELTPFEEERRKESEQKRIELEAELAVQRKEEEAYALYKETRKKNRQAAASSIYYILLALLIIGIAAFLILNKDKIWM